MENIEILWAELEYEIKKIGKDYNNLGDKKILIGSGNKNARIMFIGDDPDLYINDDLKVSPSSSGEFLIKLCDIENISPNEYYITTLAKKDCKYIDFMEEDRLKLKELLFLQIALIQPKIIVTLGTDALGILFDEEIDFKNERGKERKWLGETILLPTYDVNFVKKSRNESGKKSQIALEFWNDLKKIKELL